MGWFSDFQIEVISFWLGFLTASLVWLMLGVIRKNWSRILNWFKNIHNSFQEKRLAGVEFYIRQTTYQRSQRNHLTARLFSLDEIAIEPFLLVPPNRSHSEGDQANESIIKKVLPYIPDYPELVSGIGYPSVPLSEAMCDNVQIAIIGKPGAGKSFALAYLASIISSQSHKARGLRNFCPLYCHIYDVNLSKFNSDLPALPIIEAISYHLPTKFKRQAEKYIYRSLENNSAILILDGMDELHPSEWLPYSEFLKFLLQKYPGLRIITTADTNYLGCLPALGFIPVCLSTWGRDHHTLFLQKWSDCWTKDIHPILNKNSGIQVLDPQVINPAIISLSQHQTPLEWTLLVWSSYSGAMDGSNPISYIQSYIDFCTKDKLSPDILSAVSQQYIINHKGALAYGSLSKLLSKFKLIPLSGDTVPGKKVNKKGKTISGIDRILQTLIDVDILVQHSTELIGFSTPIIAGFLASKPPDNNPVPFQDPSTSWSIQDSAEYYWSFTADVSLLVQNHLEIDEAPLHHQFLSVGKFLISASPSSDWRSNYMRKLIQLLTQDRLPLMLRAKLCAIVVNYHDPSIPALLKQLSNNPSSIVRQIVAIGCGYYQNGELLDVINRLLGDPESDIRLTACFALSGIQTGESIQTLTQLLMTGEESLRLAAAETLAFHPPLGHEVLQNAVEVDDILTRRAVVFGLSKINQDWAIKMLEKVAVGDAQWVVRNAAAHVLEQRNDGRHTTPVAPLQGLMDSPWMISYAGKQGMGVSNDSRAKSLLVDALKNGSANDRLNALAYVPLYPDKECYQECLNLIAGPQNPLRETAAHTLWLLVATGFQPEVEN